MNLNLNLNLITGEFNCRAVTHLGKIVCYCKLYNKSNTLRVIFASWAIMLKGCVWLSYSAYW